jgi:hypothetical protein
MMYRCPADFSDGMPIDFRIRSHQLTDCVQGLISEQRQYDVILLEPWHEYEESCEALAAALRLISEGGTIVVHDCLPPARDYATVRYEGGAWCGVTYKAFVDFVHARNDVAYLTVDTDFGCGIIRKRNSANTLVFELFRKNAPIRTGLWNAFRKRPPTPCDELIRQWVNLGNDYDTAFKYLHLHKATLLNLTSVDLFFRHFARTN